MIVLSGIRINICRIAALLIGALGSVRSNFLLAYHPTRSLRVRQRVLVLPLFPLRKSTSPGLHPQTMWGLQDTGFFEVATRSPRPPPRLMPIPVCLLPPSIHIPWLRSTPQGTFRRSLHRRTRLHPLGRPLLPPAQYF